MNIYKLILNVKMLALRKRDVDQMRRHQKTETSHDSAYPFMIHTFTVSKPHSSFP